MGSTTLVGPALRLPDSPFEDLNPFIETYRRIFDERSKTGGQLQRTQGAQEKARARDADLRAAMDAAEAGEKVKEDAHEKARQAEIKRLHRTLEAQTALLVEASDAFNEHVEANRDAYAVAIEDAIRQASEAAAADLSERTFAELARLLSWRAWLERWPRKSHVLVPSAVLVHVGREAYAPGELFGALRTAAESAVAGRNGSR